MNRLLKNERGLTLVELLAALSLFAVVIALSSTVIIQLVNSEEKTSENITMKQDVNVLINELRTNYSNGENKLCVTEGQYQFYFSEVSNGDINEAGCIDNINLEETLSFKLTAANNSGENFTVQTAWSNKEKYELTVKAKKANEKEDFTERENLKRSNCVYKDNIEFIKHITTPNGNGQCQHIFEKSAKFPHGLTMGTHADIEIKEHLTLNGLVIGNKASLVIRGNLIINETLKPVNPFKTICVYGDIITEGNSENYSIKEVNSCKEDIHKKEGYIIQKVILDKSEL
ncbi:hypothetical protein CIL03_00840 [Virgibacillus indicus]|uniref:Prepilin-type cleavage/methylation domain-containing protein n=1 Tax=Virgibacillus indicus TaxID=2024554 RepID=A0A265NE48_9BACI|nr:prepilin-type N-terminal cleavage/methylation domain-containing protein [Virgibacillus indicus]OZU89719.1 hypothetical protein CIL03_00840 [Virgibacillus indicus]